MCALRSFMTLKFCLRSSVRPVDNNVNMQEMKKSIKAKVIAEANQEKNEKRKSRKETMEVDDSKKRLKVERIERKSRKNDSYDSYTSPKHQYPFLDSDISLTSRPNLKRKNLFSSDEEYNEETERDEEVERLKASIKIVARMKDVVSLSRMQGVMIGWATVLPVPAF